MTPDEDFRGVMVVRADSKLNAPGDLAGQPLCFIAPSAVAATMLPLIYLHDHGVNIKTATITHVGSPASALTHVYSGGYPACGVSVRHWRAWSKDNADKARALKILFTTPHLPHNAVIARDDVPAALAQQVASVLVGMDKDPALDQTPFQFDQNHYEHGTNQTYQPFAEFMRRYDEAIGLPAQMKLPSR
jgi:phosphonate transport system substrate-binding protein